MHGLVEAVKQLLEGHLGFHRTVVSGYGKVLYRYGACANEPFWRRHELSDSDLHRLWPSCFPPRAVCRHCGGMEWETKQGLSRSWAEFSKGLTTCGGVSIGEVRSDAGPLLISRMTSPAKVGDRVCASGRTSSFQSQPQAKTLPDEGAAGETSRLRAYSDRQGPGPR
jgi:hypothetical protein